jgi:hypothetical protein
MNFSKLYTPPPGRKPTAQGSLIEIGVQDGVAGPQFIVSAD